MGPKVGSTVFLGEFLKAGISVYTGWWISPLHPNAAYAVWGSLPWVYLRQSPLKRAGSSFRGPQAVEHNQGNRGEGMTVPAGYYSAADGVVKF